MSKLIRKKWIAVLSFLLAVSLMSFLAVVMPVKAASAEENLQEKCARFTSSDVLADTDSGKSIKDFASELDKTAYGDEVPDLGNVIPAEYLRTDGQEAVYQYIGEEYGFCVVHTVDEVPDGQVNFLHVFVVDFIWTNDYNEQEIQIKPIISEDFSYYKSEDGEDHWQKSEAKYSYRHGNVVDTYYFDMDFQIANIGFGTLLLNENELNYGDEGYDKQADDGLIIQQTRLNYKGVKKANGSGWAELGSFAADNILGRVPIVGDIYDIATTGMDFYNVIEAFENKTEQIECNNEQHIFTEQSKEFQKNSAAPSYTRAINVTPLEEIYIGKGGYAQCITLLNDTNQRSRILQQIDFDIVSMDTVGNITYYNAAEDESYRAVHEKLIFDEAFDNAEPIECGETYSVYLMPGGQHPLNILPEYDGVHTFTIDGIGTYKAEMECVTTGEIISVTGTKNVFTANLNAGERYQIRISKDGLTSYETALFRYELTGEELNLDKQQSFEIAADKAKNYYIENASANNYVIEFNAPEGVYLRVWRDEEEGNLIHTSSDRVNLLVEGGSHYYVSIMNESGGKVSGTITLRQGNSFLLNSELKLSFGSGEKMYFKFNPKLDGAYLFDTGKASCSLKIYDEMLNGVNKNSLKASETYFVCIENTQSIEQTITVTVQFNPSSISFGENNCSSEYVKFQPKSTESYLFSVNNGSVTIYDSAFTKLHSEINNKSVLLEKGEVYYVQASKVPATVKIGFDSTAVAHLNEATAKNTDEYGNAYFAIEIKERGNYSFASEGTIYLYDSQLNLQGSEQGELEQELAGGSYIVKIKGNKNSSYNITVSFVPGTVEVGSSLNVSETGENYYRFIPKYTETYKFYTRGDNNNSLTTQIVLYDADLNEIARSASGKYIDLTVDLTKNEIYYVKLVLGNANKQSVLFNVIYMSGNHESDSAQMEIFNGQASKSFDMEAGKTVAIKFAAEKNALYNFYLDKEVGDTYTVKLFNGTVYITTLTPTQLKNSEVSKYSYSLTKGTEYYFVVIGSSVDNLDTISCCIVEDYEDISLIGYSDGDIANRVDADGLVVPCMEYQLSLVNGSKVIDFDADDILVKSGEDYIDFNGASFIVKGNALGRNIVFEIEYYYETYILNVQAGNPFSDGQYSFDLNNYNRYDLIPNFKFTADTEYDLSSLTANVNFKFMGFNNQQIKSGSVNNVALNNNGLIANYSYTDYSGQDLSKLLITIRLKGNGYECAFEDVFSFIISNQKLTLSNFKSQSKGEFVYVDASGDSTSSSYTILIPSETKIVVFSGSSSKTYKVDINVNDSNNKLLVIYNNFDVEIEKGDNLLYCTYDRKITARFYGYNTVSARSSPFGGAIINTRELNVIVKSGSLTIAGYDSLDSSGGKCIKSENLTVQGTVYLYGGDGAENTLSKGGIGYVGGDAIYVTKSLYLDCTGEIKGGAGGNGATGSTGEKGADGAKGPTGTIFVPKDADDGKPGGEGGSGGQGGAGGYAINLNSTARFTYNRLPTLRGGDGGNGGTGGVGGTGGKGHNDDNANPFGGVGKPGDGGQGGTGGTGGAGGDGQYAVSDNNTIGIRGNGGDGGTGGMGGIGGNGGSSGTLGGGGKGGAGGIGGAGGEGGNNGNAGDQGSAGFAGANG